MVDTYFETGFFVLLTEVPQLPLDTSVGYPGNWSNMFEPQWHQPLRQPEVLQPLTGTA